MNTMEPIERIPLREQVYRLLLESIVAGSMRPGSRIRDQDLAAQLQVSRTPVREALQRLEDEGLVEMQPGALTRVRPLDAAQARAAFPVVATLHALATRLAVPLLTKTDMQALHGANERLTEAQDRGDTAAAIAADDAFHGVFLGVADNSELTWILQRTGPKLRRLEFAQFSSLSGRRSVIQHEAIIEACKQQDAAGAAALIEENWLTLGSQLIESLQKRQKGDGDDGE